MSFSDTPETHVTTFARQLDWRQVECKDHGVTVTNDDKKDNFVAHMYAFGLFESKVLDNLEETDGKSFWATQPHFLRQFNKERRKLERQNAQKSYESSSVFC